MTEYDGVPRIDDELVLAPVLDKFRQWGFNSSSLTILRIRGLTDPIGAGAAATGYNLDTVFDGTTVPVEVDVISDGADTRDVTIVGIDENDDIVSETITLTGNTAVTSTTLWKRLIYASAVADAARTWNIEEVGGAGSDYMTIANTELEAWCLGALEALADYGTIRAFIVEWTVQGAPLAGGTGLYVTGNTTVDTLADAAWQATTMVVPEHPHVLTSPGAALTITQTDGAGATGANIDVIIIWTDE